MHSLRITWFDKYEFIKVEYNQIFQLGNSTFSSHYWNRPAAIHKPNKQITQREFTNLLIESKTCKYF